VAAFYLSKIIGTGSMQDPYRVRAADFGSHVALIPSNADGTPKHAGRWALVVTPTSAGRTIGPEMVALAEAPLDSTLGSLGTALQLAQVQAAVQTRFGVSPDVSPGRTLRDFLSEVGAAVQPGFQIGQLDVAA
jgi:hypothetical protein